MEASPINNDYYQKNKVRLNEKKQCEICNGKYSMNTKSHHFNSKKHKAQQTILDHKKEVKELEEKLNQQKILNDMEAKINTITYNSKLADVEHNNKLLEMENKLNNVVHSSKLVGVEERLGTLLDKIQK